MMAATLAGFASSVTLNLSRSNNHLRFQSNHTTTTLRRRRCCCCSTRTPPGGRRTISGEEDSDSMGMGEKLMLKSAWYASELLGIAASFFRPSSSAAPNEYGLDLDVVEGEVIERAVIVETIKGDFERSYFVTGALTLDAYEEDCEFADPAGSFKGLRRFKRNCTNFGSLVLKSDMKLIKWEDFQDKGIGHWRFTCIMAFPWKPILSATGYTEYYLSKHSGKVCRHIEHWNVPKMALFKQLLKPSRQTDQCG